MLKEPVWAYEGGEYIKSGGYQHSGFALYVLAMKSGQDVAWWRLNDEKGDARQFGWVSRAQNFVAKQHGVQLDGANAFSFMPLNLLLGVEEYYSGNKSLKDVIEAFVVAQEGME